MLIIPYQLMIKSKDTGSGSGGKGQGKSGCARMILFLTSDIESHRFDPELSKEEIKKFGNMTGLLMCLEDIKNPKKLSQIVAWLYDDSLSYRTKEVRHGFYNKLILA